MRASDTFSAQVLDVLKAFNSQSRQKMLFMPEGFSYFSQVGCRVERAYRAYTKQEFRDVFKCEPQDLGLVAEKMLDDHGQSIQAFLLIDDAEPGLKVKMFHAGFGSTEQMVQQPGRQLRPNQSSDFAPEYMRDARSLMAKPLMDPSKGVKVSQVPTLLAEAKRKKELAAALTSRTTTSLCEC